MSSVANVIETLIDTYRSRRSDGERFIDTYRRIGIKPFKEAVYPQ